MPVPTPPADLSGGYMVTTWTNGVDSHRQRLHLRPFDNTGAFTGTYSSVHATVAAEWTALYTLLAGQYHSNWTATLTSLFLNAGGGVFNEVYLSAYPAAIAGSGATLALTDQGRAVEQIFNFKDGQGGRGRIIVIGQTDTVYASATYNGNPSGNITEQLVDYLTNQNPVKSNVVCHSGHPFQNPAHQTIAVNRRLRRHYGFS